MTRPVNDPARNGVSQSTVDVEGRERALGVVAGGAVPSDGADDGVLAERIRHGDVAAFEKVFLEHSAALFEFAYRILRSRDDAQDIVQSVFRSVWERRASWRPTASIRAYLLGATRNTAYNLARHARVVEQTETQLASQDRSPGMSAPSAAIEEVVEAADLAARIEEAAQLLAPRCRTVFLTRWRGGRTVPETARVLGLSPKTVEMQWTRALTKIRERIKGLL
jgi:RNA polymerase sigma-70 factor (family 1)